LSRLLNYDGLTPFGDRVFQGRNTFDHLDFDAPTRTLLKHLKNKLMPEISRKHPLDYEMLMQGIKKWPEKRTTSPSGRHLGIYKTLQRHLKEKDSDKGKNKKADGPEEPQLRIQQGRDVLYVIFNILNLALRHSHTLEWWKTVWTMFIEKDPGNPDLQRLRCLMLFEADW